MCDDYKVHIVEPSQYRRKMQMGRSRYPYRNTKLTFGMDNPNLGYCVPH